MKIEAGKEYLDADMCPVYVYEIIDGVIFARWQDCKGKWSATSYKLDHSEISWLPAPQNPNTVELFAHLEDNGQISYMDENKYIYNLCTKTHNHSSQMAVYYVKIPNFPSITLNLDTWTIQDE